MGPITLTTFQGGASLCLLSFLLWNVYVCNPEILGCACHSLNRMCSWAVLEEFFSTDILSVDHKSSIFQPLISSVAVQSVVFFVAGVCLFC